MSKIITCEQVSNGHPDKICDQIADAIVTDILQHDRNARVAIECLLKKSQLFIAGEVTTDYRPNYNQIVHDVFNRIGAEKLGWNLTELLRIGILVDKQSPDIAMGVDKGGAGDQGIMYGYATNETAEQMPIPYMVATKFLQLLKNHPSKMFRADAKAQVSYDYDTGRITTYRSPGGAGIRLTATGADGVYSGTANVKTGKSMTFRLIKVDANGKTTWDPTTDRKTTADKAKTLTLKWDERQVSQSVDVTINAAADLKRTSTDGLWRFTGGPSSTTAT